MNAKNPDHMDISLLLKHLTAGFQHLEKASKELDGPSYLTPPPPSPFLLLLVLAGFLLPPHHFSSSSSSFRLLLLLFRSSFSSFAPPPKERNGSVCFLPFVVGFVNVVEEKGSGCLASIADVSPIIVNVFPLPVGP